MSLQIELHLIQNFAPSCLNRDDTNTPKDCEFGGVRRARISSQCIKRATRTYFREHLTEKVSVGERTKRLKSELTKRLSDADVPEDVLPAVLDVFLSLYYSGMDAKRPDETKVLLYVSEAEMNEAARCVRDLLAGDARAGLLDDADKRQKALAKAKAARTRANKDAASSDGADETAADDEDTAGAAVPAPKSKADPKIAERLRSAALSADIALFGRMLAENPKMNVDAACQVAHALSTHAVDLEMDFYTAVDDLNPKADTGAGMLGVTGYNSACFYRYALLDRAQLVKNLGGDAKQADEVIEAFLLASVHAIPTGKQNSMAAQNLPLFGMIVVRDGGAPVSLANAFAAPVRVTKQDELAESDLVGKSVERLTTHWQRMTEVYGGEGVRGTPLFCVGYKDKLGDLAECDAKSVKKAVELAMNAVRGAKSEEGDGGGSAPTL